MMILKKEWLESLGKYCLYNDMTNVDINDFYSLLKYADTFPILYRGISSSEDSSYVLSQSDNTLWTSWSTDIDTAIEFSTKNQYKNSHQYIQIAHNVSGINISKIKDIINNHKELQGTLFDRYIAKEHEILVERNDLTKIYIFEIPTSFIL